MGLQAFFSTADYIFGEQLMKRLAYCWMTVIAGLCASALPASPPISGHYRADCAPYDGPAFIVVLPGPSSNSEFWLRANVPLQEAAGNWRHSGLSKPGDAQIALCQIAGSERKCNYPESGSFQIAPVVSGKMNGSFQARFSSGAAYKCNFVAGPTRSESRPPK